MQASNVHPLYSDGYLRISQFFNIVQPPYSLADIREFNAIYRQVYPSLGFAEKRKAEEWIDYLIKHVEKPEWAHKIYGVV